MKPTEVKADSDLLAPKRIAAIGDPHGCLDELILLYKKLEWLSLDEIWSLGDNVDRGPDSGGTVHFLIENGIKSIKGNHDASICNHWERFKKKGLYPKNKDKEKSIRQLDDRGYEYLFSSPPIHVFDSLQLILVHGGLYPKTPFHEQPSGTLVRAQMINPDRVGVNRWWGPDAPSQKNGHTEEDSRKQGFERWYRLWDHKYNVAFGHSVFYQPFVYQNPGMGLTVGCDTGSCFDGHLTASIWDGGRPWFVSVKSLAAYSDIARRVIQNER